MSNKRQEGRGKRLYEWILMTQPVSGTGRPVPRGTQEQGLWLERISNATWNPGTNDSAAQHAPTRCSFLVLTKTALPVPPSQQCSCEGR